VQTAVAATPGKTKHFQTLNVSPRLCLCDCPGLVLPQYARSKAEMVAAGAWLACLDVLGDF
jgi:large subunit GTPase 1